MENTNENKLEILVVEDGEENLAAAKVHFGNNADYASDYEQAMQKLKEKQYKGVITDLCFPEKTGAETTGLIYPFLDKVLAYFKGKDFEDMSENFIQQQLEKMEKMKTETTELPYGALIVEYCLEKDIPVVIASGEHGGRTYAIKLYFEKSIDYNEEKGSYNKRYMRLDTCDKNGLKRAKYGGKNDWEETEIWLNKLMER
jgi:hypothetical protein